MATKMTAAEYLTARGWTFDSDNPGWYVDPQRDLLQNGLDGLTHVAEKTAVTIQRARDAAEERAAWVRFASALAANWECHTAAEHADDFLAEYRKRFAVEVVPAQEVETCSDPGCHGECRTPAHTDEVA